MKILLDECTPRVIKKRLPDRDIQTVQEMGWSGIKNGDLMAVAEEQFDVFITADKNLLYQQNFSNRRLSVLVLPSNQVPIIEALISDIDNALSTAQRGSIIEIPLPE
ncbi:MAG TPA: DUF5615 family PIN-like protein [Pyrinomonadaceae bacterium]|nr:DUF5615 family PIN-like protein [Pyrinomonadaceae bacterium]